MAEIKINVHADVSDDAKYLLNRQERMERQRLEFIGDLFRYTANLVLTYDEDNSERNDEEEKAENEREH